VKTGDGMGLQRKKVKNGTIAAGGEKFQHQGLVKHEGEEVRVQSVNKGQLEVYGKDLNKICTATVILPRRKPFKIAQLQLFP